MAGADLVRFIPLFDASIPSPMVLAPMLASNPYELVADFAKPRVATIDKVQRVFIDMAFMERLGVRDAIADAQGVPEGIPALVAVSNCEGFGKGLSCGSIHRANLPFQLQVLFSFGHATVVLDGMDTLRESLADAGRESDGTPLSQIKKQALVLFNQGLDECEDRSHVEAATAFFCVRYCLLDVACPEHRPQTLDIPDQDARHSQDFLKSIVQVSHVALPEASNTEITCEGHGGWPSRTSAGAFHCWASPGDREGYSLCPPEGDP